MQKATYIYLCLLSGFMPFCIGALVMSILSCVLHLEYAVLYTALAGLCASVGYASVRYYFFSISPIVYAEKQWLTVSERCAYELLIGAGALIFAAAFLRIGIFQTALCMLALLLSVVAAWRYRGVFDIGIFL